MQIDLNKVDLTTEEFKLEGIAHHVKFIHPITKLPPGSYLTCNHLRELVKDKNLKTIMHKGSVFAKIKGDDEDGFVNLNGLRYFYVLCQKCVIGAQCFTEAQLKNKMSRTH